MLVMMSYDELRWITFKIIIIWIMAERLYDEQYKTLSKLMKKQRKKQKDPKWCLPYFTDLQAETPRFEIPKPSV